MRPYLLLPLVLALSLVQPFAAQAQIVTLNSTDRGWYTNAGEHNATNGNYVTGRQSTVQRRNWFVFNIAAGTQVESATLRLFNPSTGFDGSDASETYTLYDVTTSTSLLTASHASGNSEGQTIFNDLGSGTSFGNRVYSAADNGQFTTLTLNSAAIAAINAIGSSGGQFAIGGAITTLSPSTTGNERVFAFTSSDPSDGNTQLTLSVVPEPGTVALLGTGLLPLGSVLLRKRRRSKA